MPIDPGPYAREFSTQPACLAFVAIRRGAPGRQDAVPAAAADADHGRRAARRGRDDRRRGARRRPRPRRAAPVGGQEEIRAALEDDAAAARAPAPAPWRSTTSSPGPRAAPLQRPDLSGAPRRGRGRPLRGRDPRLPSVAAYEAAIANLDPGLPRRPRPGSVRELLSGRPIPCDRGGDRDHRARRGEGAGELATVAEPIPADAVSTGACPDPGSSAPPAGTGRTRNDDERRPGWPTS